MNKKSSTTELQKLLCMELHQTAKVDNIVIRRVPNGWLYTTTVQSVLGQSVSVASTFIPETP